MRILALTIGTAVAAVFLVWAWPRDDGRVPRSEQPPAAPEERTGQGRDAPPEKTPAKASEEQPKKNNPYANLGLEDLLKRLRAIPTPEAWRRRGVEENVWVFWPLTDVPKILKEIRKRFPDFEIPPALVYELAVWKSFRNDLQIAIATWKTDTMRAELERSASATHDDPLWQHAGAIGFWMKKRGEPIGGALARRLLEHDDPLARAGGVSLAWYTEPPPLEDVLSMTRNDPDERVRQASLWGIVHRVKKYGIEADRATRLILDSLKDPAARVRDAAIHELPEIGTQGTEPALELARAGGLGSSAVGAVVKALLREKRLGDLLALNPSEVWLDHIKGQLGRARRKDPKGYASQAKWSVEVDRRLDAIDAAQHAIEKRRGDAAFLLAAAVDRTRDASIRIYALNLLLSDHPETGTAIARKLVLDHNSPSDMRRELVGGVISAWGEEKFVDIRKILAEVARSDPNFWVRARARADLEGLDG